MKKFVPFIALLTVVIAYSVLSQPIYNGGGGSSTGTATNLTTGIKTDLLTSTNFSANSIAGASWTNNVVQFMQNGYGIWMHDDQSAGIGLDTSGSISFQANTGSIALAGSGGISINAGTFSPRAINYFTTQINANTTLNNNYYQVFIATTGKTITLPTAVGFLGREYRLKLIVSGSATIATTSSQTIDGATTYSLSAQYKYVNVTSDGANWEIVGNN